MLKKTIGGHRLGAGGKMEVEMHNYDRSTHDLSYVFRTSQAPGTLVPFMVQVALPGDTFDIDLEASVLTHPTLGPLFGSFKLQLDVFQVPVRLYHSALIQNSTAIGNNMQNVLLPIISQNAIPAVPVPVPTNIDNFHINPSALLAYLGIRGWGWNTSGTTATRNFCAIPLLAYWEIYRDYYSNKQELNGAYLVPPTPTTQPATTITVNGATLSNNPASPSNIAILVNSTIQLTFTGALPTDITQLYINTANNGPVPITNIAQFTTSGLVMTSVPGTVQSQGIVTFWGWLSVQNLIQVTTFPLTQIDNQRVIILSTSPNAQFTTGPAAQAPYGPSVDITKTTASQCGLALKTYQSDLLNNWMQTTWFTSITTATQVSTAGNVFSIDSLVLARKVYNLLNRIAISGGTYFDWLEAAYAHKPYSMANSPIYHGGLSKEVIFQEVVSVAGSGTQPLGTLAGRGRLGQKHKGGKLSIRIDEHSYLMGIVSLTPRIDYSQGNAWHTALNTMDNFHKPALDQIGFQDLITETMAWWDTHGSGTSWTQKSAGKQPAWLAYQTDINKNYGNFAIQNNEMFMTLNRRYQVNPATQQIQDLTTYIDPSHYNFIFAQTNLDAQNFWTQIGVNIIARRKMSAKIMPNL